MVDMREGSAVAQTIPSHTYSAIRMLAMGDPAWPVPAERTSQAVRRHNRQGSPVPCVGPLVVPPGPEPATGLTMPIRQRLWSSVRDGGEEVVTGDTPGQRGHLTVIGYW